MGVATTTMVVIHDGWEVAPLIRFVGVAAGGAFAVAAAQWREERERRLHAMTWVAHVAQSAILAPLPRVVGPVRLATRYRSATAEAVIGGDFYDAIETPSGTRVIVGDVKGMVCMGCASPPVSWEHSDWPLSAAPASMTWPAT